MQIHTHTTSHTCTHTAHTQHAPIFTDTHNMHTHTYTHAHAHTYVHIHTHMHMHTPTPTRFSSNAPLRSSHHVHHLPTSPPTYPPLLTSYSTILPSSLLQRCDRTYSVKKAWEVGMEGHKTKSITHPILVIRLIYSGECSQGSYTTQV